MRRLLPLCAAVIACSSEPEHPAVVDAAGDWTADFLVNSSGEAPGDDLNQFGTLQLEAAVYDDLEGDYVGNATFDAVAYAVQGSLESPLIDEDGSTLYENVGTIVYRGTWRADAQEGNTSFTIDLECEDVQLTSEREDLQALCADPFIVSMLVDCERPGGGATLHCNFSADSVVFHAG